MNPRTWSWKKIAAAAISLAVVGFFLIGTFICLGGGGLTTVAYLTSGWWYGDDTEVVEETMPPMAPEGVDGVVPDDAIAEAGDTGFSEMPADDGAVVIADPVVVTPTPDGTVVEAPVASRPAPSTPAPADQDGGMLSWIPGYNWMFGGTTPPSASTPATRHPRRARATRIAEVSAIDCGAKAGACMPTTLPGVPGQVMQVRHMLPGGIHVQAFLPPRVKVATKRGNIVADVTTARDERGLYLALRYDDRLVPVRRECLSGLNVGRDRPAKNTVERIGCPRTVYAVRRHDPGHAWFVSN